MTEPMDVDEGLRYLNSIRDADPLMGQIHDALRARLRQEREAIQEIEAFLHRPDTHDKDKLTFASAKLRALTERAKTI